MFHYDARMTPKRIVDAIDDDSVVAAVREVNGFTSARVVEQAIQVLFAIAQGEHAHTIRGFAAQLGISKSTLQRILSSLQKSGLITEVQGSESYVVSNRVLALADGYWRQNDLVGVAGPVMHKLSKLSGETVTLSVAANGYRVTIHQLESTHDLRIASRVGTQYPLVLGAGGRTLLALMPESSRLETIRMYMKSGAAMSDGELRPVDVLTVNRLVKQAIRDGYSTSFGEWDPMGVGISVPIGSPSGELAALGIYGVAHRLTPPRVAELIPEILRLTSGIRVPPETLAELSA